ncbi:MAG: hypothetical protein N4A48_03600 [Tepidibacter sp.]|uniref:hypothetical protein n=1 Tax=Tepidibacter sp. TaxID=2529387 RepID=UPI0025CE3804|nr:hypothetical protein [Tepidibacter sp.]MCT4507833.1 hypothetical protein [Tepidibacter sp.]
MIRNEINDKLNSIKKDINAYVHNELKNSNSCNLTKYDLISLIDYYYYKQYLVQLVSSEFEGYLKGRGNMKLNNEYIIKDTVSRFSSNISKIINSINLIITNENIEYEIGNLSSKISDLYRHIDLLINYNELDYAINAFKNLRYEAIIQSEDAIRFYFAKNFANNHSLEAWYNMNLFYDPKRKDIDLRKIQKANGDIVLCENNLNIICRQYQEEFDFLKCRDIKNAFYSFEEFQKVWSYLYLKSTIQNNKNLKRVNVKYNQYMNDRVSKSRGIKDFTNQLQNIDKHDKGINIDECINIIEENKEILLKECSELTKIEEKKIKIILEDLVFDKIKNIQEEPIFSTETKYYFSPCIITSINLKFLLQKLFISKYSKIYTKLHSELIEPYLCSKVGDLFRENKDFIVKEPKEYFKTTDS